MNTENTMLQMSYTLHGQIYYLAAMISIHEVSGLSWSKEMFDTINDFLGGERFGGNVSKIIGGGMEIEMGGPSCYCG